MTAAWSEQLPDRRKADRAAVVQLGLAIIGAGLVFGSLLGAAYGSLRLLAGVMDGAEEPL